MNNHKFSPESLMMSYGYKPELSEGSVKCPIFQTSTFSFKKAEDGKAFFEVAYGLREKGEKEELGLIYSRLNNPDLEILENRLCLWDGAEDCAVFESGMSAISTVLMEFTKPGDVLLYSLPVYGGTDHFIKHILTKYMVEVVPYSSSDSREDIVKRLEATGKADKLAMVYVETPANPTNRLIDLKMCKSIADQYSNEEKQVYMAVDNTYMGPLWSQPLEIGADIVMYSATKYIGGHSDVIAGAVLGSAELMVRVKTLRTFLGNMAGPWTGWLLMRSLETLKVRMDQQAINAKALAEYLIQNDKVEKVHYLGFLKEKDPKEYEIFKSNGYKTAGAMISVLVKGGEKEAFTLLNNLKLAKLAVSLGSTETLVQHPASMTHAGIDPEEKKKFGISENLVRVSVGVENSNDLIYDFEQALSKI